MLALSPRTVLLPIDFQEGFFSPRMPPLGQPGFDRNALALIAAWRRKGWPILHVRHDSAEPGSCFRPDDPGNALRPSFSPAEGEALVTKSVNSAFLNTDLDLRLKRLGADGVIAFGISTDMCVSTTVRTGNNLGWRMIVAGDACAAFEQKDLDGAVLPAAEIHRFHLATLRNEFATVASTAEILHAMAA
ncbi:MAG: cysteine hydrolase family protein [Beijerinckiaceae bacterium]|nr:cysteine hydrolase family protein [Beijerinckiaceae bacterium]MCZ8300451.1 cysteine hydrolase family protein [Beijerinckiaceae bacterium]